MDSKFSKTTIFNTAYYTQEKSLLEIKVKFKIFHYNNLKEFIIFNPALQTILEQHLALKRSINLSKVAQRTNRKFHGRYKKVSEINMKEKMHSFQY